jgi:hypothetical protein
MLPKAINPIGVGKPPTAMPAEGGGPLEEIFSISGFEALVDSISFEGWDLVLIVVVAVQGGLLAYIPSPRWKALALTLPFPYTTITLSLGLPVDASHPLAMVAMLAYIHSVRGLYQRLSLPITVAIALAVGAYSLVSLVLLHWGSGIGFWSAALGVMALGGVAFWLSPSPSEPGHRTPLPVWLKLPAVLSVVFLLVQVKGILQGFATLFPLLGVVGAYEARYSLWTLARQVPVLIMVMVPMVSTAYLTQTAMGLEGALALGWLVLLICLVPFTYWQWSKARV